MVNGEDKRITKKITVYGIVQGVGFRPLVYHIAQKHNIKGTVRNIGGIVEIIARSTQKELEDFLQDLETNQRGGCEIVRMDIEDYLAGNPEYNSEGNPKYPKDNIKVNLKVIFDDFKIIHSSTNDNISIIPPDLPVCPDCMRELYDNDDRRHLNPFISCMSCGPRYTIIEELPYDRDNTTMKDFAMCDSCNEEYTSPESRRFHAQTISCNDCGPYLIFRDAENLEKEHQDYSDQKVNTEFKSSEIQNLRQQNWKQINHELIEHEAFYAAVKLINSGKIAAVKGIGGFHFVCSPFIDAAVNNLRKLKGREEKPFAVMFENLQSVENYCYLNVEEKKLLESKARPIVLLYMKDINPDSQSGKTKGLAISPFVTKGSIYCGAFLPYTPLQMLLTRECGPLIMTSANISNQPIIRDDDVMLSLKSPFLNGVLYNTRRVVRSVDDSVAKIIDHKPQLIRRSRGYVPYPVFLQDRKDIQIFAAGGDLKAAFCLFRNGSAVVSQYFGDLEELSVMEEYKASIADLSRLLKISPGLAVCDYHPKYFSSEFTKTLGIPVLQVQHHHAHVASVMAEHHLDEPVIGVAFDGTGYGTDGNIWGSEFLVCEGADFIRAGHLNYTPILGGDQSMKDAKKTATCFLYNSGLENYIQDERQDVIKAAIKNKVNTVLTSSMGRLFDAVASILNIGQENRYEGECAANLEREAVLAKRQLTVPYNRIYDINESGIQAIKSEELSFAIYKKYGIIEIDPKPVIEAICNLRDSVDTGSLALGFHYAAADMIRKVCESIRADQNINTVALCGGVFQNTILTEAALKLLRDKGFRVYINEAVPPNDGSISLGQTYIGLIK